MSPASVPASTSCVKVLSDQLQLVIQHSASTDHAGIKAAPKPQKLCTQVENGRVVVRSIELDAQSGSDS